MEHVTNALSRLSSVLTKYIGMIIICFSVIAFFWRDGFAWTTNYTSIFLGVAMFGMGLTIHIGDFKVVFTRPKEIIIGFVAQYTIMPLIAWGLSVLLHLPTDIALGVILVGCCPGGTASNVITYIAGGDVALSVGMTITSTLAAPVMTPLLVYLLAGAWVQVSFPGMVISVVKVVLIPVLLGILLRREGCTGSCSTWYSDQLLLRKADPENIRSTPSDFCCVDRHDHQRNRRSKCGKNHDIRIPRTLYRYLT